MEPGEIVNPNPQEVVSNDGLSIELHNRHLYHGSAAGGIKDFNVANEPTLGKGLYLTPDVNTATNYANLRSSQMKTNPALYEVEVDGVKVLDLRQDENVRKIMERFRIALTERMNATNDYFYKKAIEKSLASIDSGKVKPGTVKLAVHQHSSFFSEYLQSLGYDGLIGFEGGETGFPGTHTSYVIFDPSKLKVLREERLQAS